MRRLGVVTAAVALLLVGCGGDPTAPSVLDISSSVVSIQSASGTAVAPTGPFTVTFDHAMLHAESMKVLLREGGREGPVIAASAVWSQDRTGLTVTPGAALKSRTQYTVELQCTGMSGQGGASHDAHHGAAAGGMMGGGHAGMHGAGGMMGGQGMMGAHGMTFSFTTS